MKVTQSIADMQEACIGARTNRKVLVLTMKDIKKNCRRAKAKDNPGIRAKTNHKGCLGVVHGRKYHGL
jgi:hypothetical protein